ncbi:MAG: hypothetical protein C0600_15610 [Ignavibacteria bacterium]|nr:MAG: hypothetical protein C0600_15610 [Ignavibacteria bacterium]
MGDEAAERRAEAPVQVQRRYSRLSWVISLLLHACVLTAALFITLLDPTSNTPEMDVRLFTSEKQVPVASTEWSLTESSPSRVPPPADARLEQQPEEMIEQLPEIATPEVISATADEIHFTIPEDILKKEWTPEEAYGLLSQLIDEYPQYKDMVLREMIAGHGFAPDTAQPIDLCIRQMLSGGIKPSWGNQRQSIEQAFGSFNGVSGWSQNSNYGGGVNILGLINFLIGLIKDDD